jgi:hypothetical protein
MATTNKTKFTVTSTGDGNDSEWTTEATNNAGAAGGPVRVTLVSGDNTIVVPTGAIGVILKPPSSSGVTKRLKHHAGETGFSIRTGEAAALPLPTGTTSLILNSSGIEVIYVHWT